MLMPFSPEFESDSDTISYSEVLSRSSPLKAELKETGRNEMKRDREFRSNRSVSSVRSPRGLNFEDQINFWWTEAMRM